MSVPQKVIEATAREIRNADKQYAGLIIWRMAKEHSGYPTTSQEFETFKRELAQSIGRRGGNAYAKKIRVAKGQQNLKGIK